LVNGIAACGNCHTPRGSDSRPLQDQELSGGLVPAYHAVAANITPDNETGIGSWTDDQIVDSIRNGKRPDGTAIGPPMPVRSYRNLSDSDALAIVAYLRSVKPVRREVEKSAYKIPPPDQYGAAVTHVPDVAHGNNAAYGEYLASAGHCMECHTPAVNGRPDMTRIGAGGRTMNTPATGMVISANLTPANPDGISHWTDQQIKDTIATGERPDGRRLARLMAFAWYRNIDAHDLDALIAYLRTLKAAAAP
jgi:mono/diheme cytochrome c family protein